MDQLDIKIDAILKSSDSPLKCAIFDSTSRKYISDLISYKKFLINDFFYFDILSNKRANLEGATCFLFISKCSIVDIYSEIKRNLYSSYIICLLQGKFCKNDLQKLAQIDENRIISNVFEINLGFKKDIENVFLIDKYKKKDNSNCVSENKELLEIFTKEEITIDNSIKSFYHQILDISSILNTFYVKPQIYFQPKTNKNLKIIIKNILGNEDQDMKQKKGTIIVLNRTLDFITPILYDWRYSGLIKQIFKDDLQNIKLDKKKISIIDDEFFKKNKFNDLCVVQKNLENLSKSINIQRKNLTNTKAKVDDNEIIESVEKDTKNIESLENNLKISEKLIEQISKRKIDCNFEFELLKDQKTTIKSIKNIFKEKEMSDLEKARILTIAILLKRENFSKFRKEFPELLKLAEEYFNTVYKDLELDIDLSNTVDNQLSKKYDFSFYNNDDIKLSLRSPISKVLKNFLGNTLSSKFNLSFKHENSIFPIFIYFKDGISYNEIYQINYEIEKWKKYNNIDKNKDVFVITDSII